MKTVDQIEEIVNRIEEDQAAWITLADEMEAMWSLSGEGESDDEQTVVTSSAPFNAVATARRMVDSLQPNIECPAIGFDATDDEAQAMKERWLKAVWRQVASDSGENVISSAFWQCLVLGKGVLQALWVKDALPSRMQKDRLPFIIRTLDPRLCGFERGPIYMAHAFYKSEMTNLDVKQQSPEYMYDEGDDDTEVEVTEFWWNDPEDGKVWMAVIVDSEFVVEPVATKYFDIPLVPFSGMYQPSEDEATRHLSLLYPLRSSNEVTNDVLSMTATNLLYYLIPSVAIINENGEAVNDEPMLPGEYRQFPAGTSIQPITVAPNAPLANQLLGMMNQETQESTFTGAANGQPLGSNQAGYSYNAAMSADESRIQEYRSNLQIAMAHINRILLGFVSDMAGAKGVIAYGRAASEGGRYLVELTPETVGDSYQNEVYLKPVLDRDEAARLAMFRGLSQDGIISKQTVRDIGMSDEIPDDEAMRVELERAMENPATASLVALHTLQAYGSNTPAAQQIIQVLQMQSDMMMQQLQAQTEQMQAQAQQQQQQQVQQPSMSGGMNAPVAEGQLTQPSFSGDGGQVTPEQLASLAAGPEGA